MPSNKGMRYPATETATNQKWAPKGPIKGDLCTVRGPKAPDLRKHCARGGTRTAFQPLQTLDSRPNIRNPGQSSTGTAQSVTQSVDTVHTPILLTKGLPQTAAPRVDSVRRYFAQKHLILLEKFNRGCDQVLPQPDAGSRARRTARSATNGRIRRVVQPPTSPRRDWPYPASRIRAAPSGPPRPGSALNFQLRTSPQNPGLDKECRAWFWAHSAGRVWSITTNGTRPALRGRELLDPTRSGYRTSSMRGSTSAGVLAAGFRFCCVVH
jgi:hypothetical protein